MTAEGHDIAIWAGGQARISANDLVQVHASGSSKVEAANAVVTASGAAEVYAHLGSEVIAFGSATVEARDQSQVIVGDGATVILGNRRGGLIHATPPQKGQRPRLTVAAGANVVVKTGSTPCALLLYDGEIAFDVERASTDWWPETWEETLAEVERNPPRWDGDPIEQLRLVRERFDQEFAAEQIVARTKFTAPISSRSSLAE